MAAISERHRLAMGLEILDSSTLMRVRRRVDLVVEGSDASSPFERSSNAPRFLQHESGVYALSYTPTLFRPGAPTIDVRVIPAARRFVPRRLRVPIVNPAVPDFASDYPSHAQRDAVRGSKWRSIVVYPASNYDIVAGVTGFRGKVIRDQSPIVWGRVEAKISGQVVGRAHTDDRGEFLLFIGALPEPLRSPTMTISVAVSIFAPPLVATNSADPIDGLPLEDVSALGPSDDVTLGTTIPASYVAAASRSVVCRLGNILSSEIEPFVLN